MELVLRPLLLYFVLLVVTRMTGKRSLGEVTAFDFILLLILSETVSNAIVGQDSSLTAAVVAFTTLLTVDVLFSLLTRRLKLLERFVEEEAVVILRDGKVIPQRLRKERVDEKDILEAARQIHGIQRMEDIAFAILERGGHISIIPTRKDSAGEGEQ
jgi:uncharacterized membrane protein YcaP (DUF421 family)